MWRFSLFADYHCKIIEDHMSSIHLLCEREALVPGDSGVFRAVRLSSCGHDVPQKLLFSIIDILGCVAHSLENYKAQHGQPNATKFQNSGNIGK